jgi:hypothetical protein
MAAQSVELLFWDGEARDAETLIRQMAREALHVGICGGDLDRARAGTAFDKTFMGIPANIALAAAPIVKFIRQAISFGAIWGSAC